MTEPPPLPRSGTSALAPLLPEEAPESSPLPPAHELARYNAVFPGLAERIVTLAEQEQAHRHTLERRALEGDMADTRLGQVLGFLIGLAAIGGGAYAALRGAQWAGSVIGGGGIVGLVWVFVQGRRTPPRHEGAEAD